MFIYGDFSGDSDGGSGDSGKSRYRVAMACYVISDTGYPHIGRANNTAYRHDRRADKQPYSHDREIDIQMLKMSRNGYILS